VEVLEKRQGALAVALRMGWENLIPRALWMTDNGIDMGVTKLESGMSFLHTLIPAIFIIIYNNLIRFMKLSEITI
jgi:hypothetical protein